MDILLTAFQNIPSDQGDENSPSDQPTNQQPTHPHLEELIDGWTPAPNNGRLAAPGLHHMKKKLSQLLIRNDKKPRYSKKQLINLWILKYLKIAPPFSHDSHDQPTADQSLDQIFSAQG